MALLEVKNLKKVYTTRFGGNHVHALSNVSFSVEQGEYVAVMGESGSGKTTLLNILAALDKPTSGEVLLGGRNIVTIKEREISAFRRDNLGFVFQDFNLLDTFSIRRTACCACLRTSTARGRPSSWSPTAPRPPATPSACCFCGTARCSTSSTARG